MECKACNHELRCSVCDSFAEDRDIAALEVQLAARDERLTEWAVRFRTTDPELAAEKVKEQLAASEARVSECVAIQTEMIRERGRLENKLAASEAKCAELLSMIADLGEEIAAALARAEAAELWMYALGDFAKRAVQLFRDFAEKVDPNHEKPMANAIDALGMILEDHLAALRQAMGD